MELGYTALGAAAESRGATSPERELGEISRRIPWDAMAGRECGGADLPGEALPQFCCFFPSPATHMELEFLRRNLGVSPGHLGWSFPCPVLSPSHPFLLKGGLILLAPIQGSPRPFLRGTGSEGELGWGWHFAGSVGLGLVCWFLGLFAPNGFPLAPAGASPRAPGGVFGESKDLYAVKCKCEGAGQGRLRAL